MKMRCDWFVRQLAFFTLIAIANATSAAEEPFPAKEKVPNEIFSLNEDGTCWKSILRMEGHPMCGSVAVSPDGKLLAFEAATEKQPQEKGKACSWSNLTATSLVDSAMG